jgi:hypothetical protein
MLIRINHPNNQLDWIVIQTDSIVSISPSTNTPTHCLVNLSDQRSFHLEQKIVEELLLKIMPTPRIQDGNTILPV